MSDHVGGWAHIEVWVEHPEDMVPFNNDDQDHLLSLLVDGIADLTFEWGTEHHVDPSMSATMNANPPDWATDEDED